MGHYLSLLPQLEIWKGEFADFDDIEDVYNSLMAILCIASAGLASGLTIGLLSMDRTKLEIKLINGDPAEKKAAANVLSVLKHRHQLMVTLLLFNSSASETLPIFLGAVMPNLMAVLLSVASILVFGEIVPSACFSGRRSLLLSSRLTYLVYFLLTVLYPVAYPISLLLDWAFGKEEEETSLMRSEMEALLTLHSQSESHEHSHEHNHLYDVEMTQITSKYDNENAARGKYKSLESVVDSCDSHDDNRKVSAIEADSSQRSTVTISSKLQQERISTSEVKMLNGVLALSKRTVKQAMLHISKVYMISSSLRLNRNSLMDILNSGYSRIPVYRRHDKQHMLGYILVKELLLIEHSVDTNSLEDLSLREPKFVSPDLGLLDMLSAFQEGSCHLAMVTADPALATQCVQKGKRPIGNAVVQGIITLEDVLEVLIQASIQDETDQRPSVYPQGFQPTSLVTRMGSKRGAARDAVTLHSGFRFPSSGQKKRVRYSGEQQPLSQSEASSVFAARSARSLSLARDSEQDVVHIHIDIPTVPVSEGRNNQAVSDAGELDNIADLVYFSPQDQSPHSSDSEANGIAPFIEQLQGYSSLEEAATSTQPDTIPALDSNQTTRDTRFDWRKYEWM